MDTLDKLKQYLDQNKVPYQVILHEEVHTAQELAQSLHTPGQNLVKVVVVKIDTVYRVVVLPATRRIDLSALQRAFKATCISIATEPELKTLFPEAEVGAMPPFGNLYHLDVWADESLTKDEFITFNAGTSYQAVRMLYRDFERLVKPGVARFTCHL